MKEAFIFGMEFVIARKGRLLRPACQRAEKAAHHFGPTWRDPPY
jgi:hypothetical protein